VPSPSKPCGQARRKLKKTKEKLDLAHVRPTHKLEEEGRPYHFPSYTSSLNNQTNKKKKCTSRLRKDKRGLEIATKSPRGLGVLCVSL
jgi:hypothetical protein